MPVVFQKNDPDFTLAIWQSTETTSELLSRSKISDKEIQTWNLFQSENRKREWLTVRALLQVMIPDKETVINYDDHGKPFVKNGLSISISHSRQFVAVILSQLPHVGIDLETIHPRILALARKFVSPNESRFLTVKKQVECLHVIWGAKEVLFKIHGIGGLDFKTDLAVEQFQYLRKGEVKAAICKKDFSSSFLVQYEEVLGCMLVYAISG